MKRLILLLLVLALPVVSAMEMQVDVSSSEKVNAEFNLNSPHNSVVINGQGLATIQNLRDSGSGGGILNAVEKVFYRMAVGFQTGEIYNRLFHQMSRNIFIYLDSIFINKRVYVSDMSEIDQRLKALEEKIK